MFNKKNTIEPVIETTSFLLKNIDADLWRKFKVKTINVKFKLNLNTCYVFNIFQNC